MRGDHNLRVLKTTAKTLCIKCGDLTLATCGILNQLCHKCLDEKRKIKESQFIGKKKRG